LRDRAQSGLTRRRDDRPESPASTDRSLWARWRSQRPASRRLRHLARTQAARADADAFDAAVDHRAHPLKIRLEPPRAHVVRVAHLAADDGRFSTDLTLFGHFAA